MSIELAEIKDDSSEGLGDIRISLHDPHIYIIKQDMDWIAMSGTMLIELHKKIGEILEK